MINLNQMCTVVLIISKNITEDVSASSYDGLDQSCEGWLAEYFNDAEMLLSSDDMYVSMNLQHFV